MGAGSGRLVQRYDGKGEPTVGTGRLPVGVPPLPPHKLFGRDEAIADLRARLMRGEGAALTALHGLPGVGKTTLATAIAHDDAVRKHFLGGVYWAALGPQGDAESALNRWGNAVGVELGAARDAREKAQRLGPVMAKAAGGAPVLLVVDDVWAWDHAKAFKEIAFPGCVQVCTTRDATIARKFAGRETWVPELSEEEAVAFLEARCPEAVQADEAGVRELARAVGGLPLGLALIAAMLGENAGQPRWVRKEIERLKATEARLALEGGDREGSLRAIVEMSVEALPEEVRGAFAGLGAFAAKPATFGREAALAVWGVDEEEETGDGWLKGLVDRGLLETAGDDRFAVHPVMGDVATTRGRADDTARMRHASFYRSLVVQNQHRWRWVERDLEQIWQGWRWTSARDPNEANVVAYAYTLRTCIRSLGVAYLELGDDERALAYFEQALPISRDIGDRASEAGTLVNIGMVHSGLGDMGAAIEHLEHAHVIQRDLGDLLGAAGTLDALGVAYSGLGNKDRALRHLQEALAIYRDANSIIGEAITLNNIGNVFHDLADHDAAIECFERALAIWRSVDDSDGEATALHNLGALRFALGGVEHALEYLDRALTIRRDLGDRAGEATTLSNIARANARLGRVDEAIAIFERVVEIDTAIQHRDLASDRADLEDLRAQQRALTVPSPFPPQPPSMPPSPSLPPPARHAPTTPPLFSWLHLSDVHFGHPNIAHRWDQALVLDALRRDIAGHASRGVPSPAAIVVTGDIAFSGAAEQYASARAWLLDLAALLKLGLEHVFLVPGNHDVDRSMEKADRNVARLLRGLRAGAEDLDDALASPADRALLTQRMAAYLAFAAGFPNLASPDPTFWSHTLTSPAGLPVRLVGLSTALLAADDEDKGKLRLGKQPLARTLTGLPGGELILVLTHHPLREGWLADQREADTSIRSRSAVHLFGHVHEADSEDARTGSGQGLLRIAAGAVHGDAGAPASHGYNFAAVVAGEDGGLRLRIWPRRWAEKKLGFIPDGENTPEERPFAEHALPGLRAPVRS